MFKQPQVARAVVVQLGAGHTAQLGAGHTAQLGVGAHELTLTDRIVDLEAMWGASGRALYEALHALDAPRIAARIADAITQRAADEPASARLAHRLHSRWRRCTGREGHRAARFAPHREGAKTARALKSITQRAS